MTVSTTPLRNDYISDGIAVTYAFEFIVLEETTGFTIKVLAEDANGVITELVQDSDYTVTLGTEGTGSITLTTAQTSGNKISLLSDVPLTQETDYINIGTDKTPLKLVVPEPFTPALNLKVVLKVVPAVIRCLKLTNVGESPFTFTP